MSQDYPTPTNAHDSSAERTAAPPSIAAFRVATLALLALSLASWVFPSSAVELRNHKATPLSPCSLVLTAQEENPEIGRQVARLRTTAIGTAPRFAALERLGWAFVARARESLDPGYYVMADWCAQCIEEEKAGRAESLRLRAHIHHSLHRFGEAERVARELVDRHGEWFDHALLGDALMELGRLDEAAIHYQLMMDVRPGPQSYSRAAHLHWLRGDLAGATELMEMAARAVSPRSRESAAWMHVRLALYRLQSGKNDSAERSAEKALFLLPDYPPALHALGRIRLARFDPGAAVPALRAAARANPLPDYQWALLDALELTKRHSEAAEVRETLRRSGAANDPRTTALYLSTAQIDVEEALRLARAELQQRQDGHTYDALAWALAANGQYEAAEESARSALAAGTADSRIYLHAGIIAEKMGDVVEAGAHLARATSFADTLLPSERRRLEDLRARLDRQFAG